MITSAVISNLLIASDSSSSSPASHRSASQAQPKGAGGALPGKPETAVAAMAGTTSLRCGGCQASGLYGQDEHCYGVLVHAFLARHEQCGNAMTITRVRDGR